jgi:hypothetical protein
MLDKERVIQILKDQTHGIKFRFIAPSNIRVNVDYSTFFRVAEAIEADRIILNFKSRLPMGSNGKYFSENISTDTGRPISGTLFLLEKDEIFSRGGVIHESVHASLDLTHNPRLMALENEAAAYIAEDLFYKSINYYPRYANNADGIIMEISRAVAFSISNDGWIPTESIALLMTVLGQVVPYNGSVDISYPSNG